MNENWSENVLCCFLLLVLRFRACFHLLFVAFCCSSLLVLVFGLGRISSISKTKAWFPFGLFVSFVARSGFFLHVLVFRALMSVVAFCCSS